MKRRMIQYSIWPNCNNNCKFCLRKERVFYSKEERLAQLEAIRENVKLIDWKEFPYGISLLGGEIFNLDDNDLQESFMQLVDVIIDNILLDNTLPEAKFSSVTNGIYDPSFLFRVVDMIVAKSDISKVDVNFSYDLKYRYKSEEDRKRVLSNINQFHQRYNYKVGVQMILTGYVISKVNAGEFNIRHFL